MRIAIFSNKFYPNIGGVETTTRTMARALVELGHRVTVLTSTPRGPGPELQEGYRIVRSIALPVLVAHFRRADLVISKGGVSAAAGLAAMLARRPLVIVYEMSGPYLHRTDGLKTALFNRIREKACRYASLHVGVSRSCLESKGLPPQATQRAIYNPVAPELMELAVGMANAPQEGMRYDIAFIGRVIRAKGVFVLAEALRRFEESGQSLSVGFVGGGGDLEGVKARMSGWRHVRVDFTGPLTGPALAAAYRAAKSVVVPSTHPEGMGLIIAEAFAFGRPVIGSDQPVIKEVVGDAGLIFRNGDDADLYQNMRRLLNDESLYASCAQRARARAAMFSPDAYKQALAEALSLFMAEAPARYAADAPPPASRKRADPEGL